MIQTLNTPEIHVNDFGTQLRFTVKNSPTQPFNLSETDAVNLWFRRPDATSFYVVCTLEQPEDSTLEPGETGEVFYILEEGDVDVAGQWYFQLEIIFPFGSWRTSIIPRIIYPNI